MDSIDEKISPEITETTVTNSPKKSRKKRRTRRKSKRASNAAMNSTRASEEQTDGGVNSKDFSMYKLIWKIIMQKKGSVEVIHSLSANDSPLHQALSNIRRAYSPKLLKTDVSAAVNYGKLNFRLAYIYAFLTSHVNFVRKMWRKFWPQAKKHFPLDKVRNLKVCAIGGGPGPDILGLNFFLQDEGLNPSIAATILDKWPQWQETSLGIASALREETGQQSPTISYAEFDFFQHLGAEHNDLIADADIVTIVKFLSVVCQDNKEVCSTKLIEILDVMKTEALLFFVENSCGHLDSVVLSAASKAGFQLLAENSKRRITVSKTVKNEMNDFKLKGNQQFYPQKGCKLVGSLWVKAATAA